MSKIYFPQYARGREGTDVINGETILAHIRRIGGVEIDSECGGQGICGKDAIRVEKGVECLSPLTEIEQKFMSEGTLPRSQRLACQARVVKPDADITVFMPDFGKYTILTDVVDTHTKLNPCVFRKNGHIVYHTGEDMGTERQKILGLAIDVGTTTLVMQVIDLATGENVGKPLASKNPQIAYGNDVISRVGYTITHKNGLKELHDILVTGINKSLAELERLSGFKKGEITKYIYDIVVVGNSTMRGIFFKQNVHDLGVVPFEPSAKQPLTRKARCLGLKVNPEALCYGAALIGGHAGADCLADIIATGLDKQEDVTMIVDIGTNGEVVIGNNKKIMTASCAAGGAYEGYQIKCGVGAIEGAITSVRSDNGKLKLETLGNKPPLGVCGSGVIDLLAEMLRISVMNDKARIQGEYAVTDTLTISQEDINQLITAKAGLRADQDMLICYYGVSLDDVKNIYLAGGFGNYMDIDNAIVIGLLPAAKADKFVRFGNGALAGAKVMLLSKERRHDSERLSETIKHTKPNEIEGEKFQYLIAEKMYFNT